MAIKTKEEIIQAISGKLGDDDEGLAILEDVSDTLANLEAEASDTIDWKAKFEENDKAWREKYKERFLSGTPAGAPPEPTADPPKPDPKPEEQITIDELFK
jgi:hypothetical protein